MYKLFERYPTPKVFATSADDAEWEAFGIDRMPHEVFTCKHNPEKIDPSYHKQLCAYYEARPDEFVYFKHNPEAVRVSDRWGLPRIGMIRERKTLPNFAPFLAPIYSVYFQ